MKEHIENLTFNVNGGAYSSLDSSKKVLSGYIENGYFLEPTVSGNVWYFCVCVNNGSSFNTIQNTTQTIHVYYVD